MYYNLFICILCHLAYLIFFISLFDLFYYSRYIFYFIALNAKFDSKAWTSYILTILFYFSNRIVFTIRYNVEDCDKFRLRCICDVHSLFWWRASVFSGYHCISIIASFIWHVFRYKSLDCCIYLFYLYSVVSSLIFRFLLFGY